ncbi:MAG: hypothetical protein WC527_00920 [Candidatus Margulisiibacteriota bacterium]
MKKIFPAFLICAVVSFIAVLFLGCGVLPPVISGITVSPSGTVLPATSVSISAEAISYSGLALSYTWNASGGSLSSNTGSIVAWTAPAAAGTYTITLVVSDGTNSVTDTVSIVVVEADAPIINSLVAVPNPVVVGKNSAVTCTATDPNSLTLSYTWIATSGTVLSGGSSIEWKAPAITGLYEITVIVTNTKGASSTDSLNIEAVNAAAPVITNLAASASAVDSEGSLTLTCYASDPYGLDLTYTWSGSGTFTGDGSNVTWNAPSVTSTVDKVLTVTVSNGVLSTSRSVTITVRYD